MQSNQTSSQQGGFFAAHPVPMPIADAFALQTGQNHGLQLFCPAPHAHTIASAKTCYALPARKPTIVLPAFAQSFPADGKHTV